MTDPLAAVSTRRTSQTEKADERQSLNPAGGYTFTPDDWTRLHRFLTLGTEGGTFYTSAKDLTKDNATIVINAATTDPMRLVNEILAISEGGRAPRQNPAIFALAIAASASNDEGKAFALSVIPRVCRTGTHLFLFTKYIEQFRGWGPMLKTAVGRWYTEKRITDLAYQVLKYRQREGLTHRDLLRLVKPTGVTAHDRRVLFNWIVNKGYGDIPFRGGEFTAASNIETLGLVEDFIEAQICTTASQFVRIVERGRGISWEMLPDVALGFPDVWAAMIQTSRGMPQEALIKQLPRLTNLGLCRGEVGHKIAEQIQDTDRLIKARMHPIKMLVAQKTYAQGHGEKGKMTWAPVSDISDALDAGFYNAYGAVEPANKSTLLALDISSSMTWARCSGLPLNAREASAALSMVTAAIEPEYRIVGFSTTLQELDISPRRRLDDIMTYIDGLDFGGTDCALPMVWALRNKVKVETFITLTDSETYYGNIHPHQALRNYRDQMGIDSRLIVVAMTAGRSSIADPTDRGEIDVSGFDSNVPTLMSDFSRGDI